jgi:hypothetical protein
VCLTTGHLEQGLSSQEADSVDYQKSCYEVGKRIICEFLINFFVCIYIAW